MKKIIRSLSVIVAITSLILALLLMIFCNDGFISGLGTDLGLCVLGLGNLLVLALNAFYWWRYGAPGWLKSVVLLQALPALGCMIFLARETYNEIQNSRTVDRSVKLHKAIRDDNLEQFVTAQAECADQCSSLDMQLLDAADAGSLRVATKLVQQSALVTSGSNVPSENIYTCEDQFLPDVNALGLAVAHDNAAMVQLLFPISDMGSRRKAMWLAARLDRLDMVKLLAQDGAPLNIRGEILNENNTLLVAAASGSAVHVGQWLIESQHMPVEAIDDGPDPYPGMAPLEAWFLSMRYDELPPRASSFLHLLIKHGANINAQLIGNETLLAEAVRINHKNTARLLLSEGANPNLLDATERDSLKELLAKPDEKRYPDEPRVGCIVVDAQPPVVTAPSH